MTRFNIDIISDTVCPWCYVGYRRLKTAIAQHLEQHPADAFSLAWHPFQLDPSAPKGRSIDKRSSYESKFGVEGAEVIFERLRSAGKDTGIVFSFAGRTGSTVDSHRLIEFARLKDEAASKTGTDGDETFSTLQTRVVEELFSDYFEHERDITSYDVLIAAAGRVGLAEGEVREFLESDELALDVKVMASDNRGKGVNGVPNFAINDTFTVEGGQESAAFLMLFNRLKKREGAAM